MKKYLVGLLATVAVSTAGEYVPVIITDNPVSNNYVKMVDVDTLQGKDGVNGIDGQDGTNGSDGINGTNGTNGTNGVDGSDADATDLYNKLRATQSAVSSVELNPDHSGLSVGMGVSQSSGINAGAIGIMYGVKADTVSVGYNIKAYKAEGGHEGVSAGVTVGF